MLLYGSALAISTLALCYASVPLYKVFCQATGFGGTTRRAEKETAELLKPAETSRVIRVTFDGSVSDSLPWSFVPAQRDVRVVPGESALAFYVTKNNSEKAITGVATYNVMPPQAGPYFVKIQCFCFDEQRLQAGEEVDMPVLFVIDPKFLEDPSLKRVSNITLSFRADLLKSDAIMVMDPLMNALGLTDPNSGWGSGGPDPSLLAQLGPSSPLEIEINGNFTHVGQWLPVSPISQCQSEHYDPHWENHTT